MRLPDADIFCDDAIPTETRKLNEKLLVQAENGPDPWDYTPQQVRDARRQGKGVFPLEAYLEDARTFDVPDGERAVQVRIIPTSNGKSRGTFLHIHGGGWVVGAADLQDERLRQLADATGLDCASIEYRLAPENPHPAQIEDCETVALWLARGGDGTLNTNFLAIGGESAGAHLSVLSLLALRDKFDITPFKAAVLTAGIYDVSRTPSASLFEERLILRSKDMQHFAGALLQTVPSHDWRNPHISPLYAQLYGMPPAHFSVGTKDALLDDSIFMASRWYREQSDCELDVYPGGCHVFQYFADLPQAQESRSAMANFLNRQIEKQQ